MATLVICQHPNSMGSMALGIEDDSGEVMLVYPADVEGFKFDPAWTLPLLLDVTLETLQDRLPEALLRLGEQLILQGGMGVRG